jgi:hypothetical protein
MQYPSFPMTIIRRMTFTAMRHIRHLAFPVSYDERGKGDLEFFHTTKQRLND